MPPAAPPPPDAAAADAAALRRACALLESCAQARAPCSCATLPKKSACALFR
jgi:hypothetical protein